MENDLAHSLSSCMRQERARMGERVLSSFSPPPPFSFSFCLRRRRARNSFSPSPFRMRTGSGKHGESLRCDSGHVGGIYSRGGRSRMASCSSPSEFPGLRVLSVSTRYAPSRPPPAQLIVGGLSVVDFCPTASVFSLHRNLPMKFSL